MCKTIKDIMRYSMLEYTWPVKKPARFYRLAACPPMLRWICSSPSNAEDKRIRLHLCYSFPGATIIISIGGHATNFVQVLLHRRALEGMLHCSYKLLFVVAHKSLKTFCSRTLSSAMEGELQVHLSIGGHAARR